MSKYSILLMVSVVIILITGCSIETGKTNMVEGSGEADFITESTSQTETDGKAESKTLLFSDDMIETEATSLEINGESAYIFPNSDKSWLSYEDMKNKDIGELRIGRNEIYARHGRKFASKDLQDYFVSKDWYQGIFEPEEFDEGELNDFEKHNIAAIKALEFQRELVMSGEIYQFHYVETSYSTGEVVNERSTDTIDIFMQDIDTVELIYHGNIGNELSDNAEKKLIYKRRDTIFEYPSDGTFEYEQSIVIDDGRVIVVEDGADAMWIYK